MQRERINVDGNQKDRACGQRRAVGQVGMGFSVEQVQYLKSLDAVEDVVGDRITYTQEFRRWAADAYADGGSPTSLFRQAGLAPELIGRKRIERFFERAAARDYTLMMRRRRAVVLAGDEGGVAQCRYKLVEAALSCPLHPTLAERLSVAKRCCQALGLDGLPFSSNRGGRRGHL